MRNRIEIEEDHHPNEKLTIEILLDIRDLLMKQEPTIHKGWPKGKKRGKRVIGNKPPRKEK
jgi:hypothetical protein